LRAVALQFFVNGAVVATFIPRLPEIRDRVGISVAVLGLLLTIAGACGLASSAAVGPLVGRFGTRRIVIGGGVVLLASLPVIGLARSPVALLAGLVLMLSVDVLVDVGMNMQASWLSSRRHAPVMNRLHGLWSLGTVAGGLVAARLAAAGVPVPVHLTGAAVALLPVLVVVGRGLLRTDEHPSDRPAGGAERSVARRAGGALSDRSRKDALVMFGLAGLFAVAMESTSSDWAAFRLTDDFGASAGFAGLGFVAFTAGMTAGRLGGDWLQVRLGRDRLLLLASAFAAVGLTAAAFIPDRHATLAAYLLAGLGIATFLPRLYDDAAKRPGRPGAGLGALTGGARAGILTAPLVVGSLAAGSLTVGTATAIVTVPSIVGFTLVMVALRRRQPPG
jgi:fucose permease